MKKRKRKRKREGGRECSGEWRGESEKCERVKKRKRRGRTIMRN